jgi:hypothetical protein
LYVAPYWRKNLQGVSLGEVLSCLAINLMCETHADAMIAMPRADRKINEMIYARGAVPIQKGLPLHNVEIDLVRFDNRAFLRNPEKPEDYYIDLFWENRTDLAQFTFEDLIDQRRKKE